MVSSNITPEVPESSDTSEVTEVVDTLNSSDDVESADSSESLEVEEVALTPELSSDSSESEDVKNEDVESESDSKEESESKEESDSKEESKAGSSFVHLHVHTQYSILDGAARIDAIVEKASRDNMKAMAITDHGTMYGIKEFHKKCTAKGIKPILGCEAYVARRGHKIKDDKKIDGYGNHLVILAKNEVGYHNLIRLISIANIDGVYYRPRIDKELLEKYSEGLIILSACIAGEIPRYIHNEDIEEAERSVEWFKRVFKDDFYLEIQRHPTDHKVLHEEVYERQERLIPAMYRLSEKFGVKVVVTNDVHFTNSIDADPHDMLVCLNTGKDYDDPNRMSYTKQEWFKTTAEMRALFSDHLDAVEVTQEIAAKVESYELNKEPIMPEFPIPESFGTIDDYCRDITEADLVAIWGDKVSESRDSFNIYRRTYFEAAYLKHIVYEGAKKRYGDEFKGEVLERIDFELDTIKSMGFPGYFLIVQDFIVEARKTGVLVGPGRGSAAGSAVAYCAYITDVDPIAYDLLFERFLNPDRISMPDIDIDFDDDGRQSVMEWVTRKYGVERVAHICTFGSMAAKSAIKDVARVLKLPLPESNRLAKMIPEEGKMTIPKAYDMNPDLLKEKQSPNPVIVKTLTSAETLEGSVRQTGVHACGVLIGKYSLTENIPLKKVKGIELLVTQYDGRFVEDIGLLKMDFLGLKTLSIIKDALINIEISKGIKLTIDDLPLDDKSTYDLFSRGETTAIFQFESAGMKKYLKQLQPNVFGDLVAMNALYRPGPMDNIPSFIDRKHGRIDVVYDIPMMKAYLEDTYGITVFQEQVMLLSRLLGNFTRGESDTLRKAMGKKNKEMMDELKVKFEKGCKSNELLLKECRDNDIEVDTVVEKIWVDWAKFAQYAFNKSHSVCYAILACKTGYLKANYPAEFMAAVLSRNLTNMDKISGYMEECKGYMGIDILCPDVNESHNKFTVNTLSQIRFGLVGIKGVGEATVDALIKERTERGPFKDIYDFVERVPLKTVNRKNIESLGQAGAFDSFEGIERSMFFPEATGGVSFVEGVVRYGMLIQEDKNKPMASLFGGMEEDVVVRPSMPEFKVLSQLFLLEKEHELIGLYLSAHPLDSYKMEIESLCKDGIGLEILNRDIDSCEDRALTFAGRIEECIHGTSRNGKPFANVTLVDYSGKFKFFFIGDIYSRYSHLFDYGKFILIKGVVERNHYRSGSLEFQVNFVDDLNGVMERINEIELDVDISKVTKDVVDELYTLISGSSGSSTLKFNIYDSEINVSVPFSSMTSKIVVNRDLLQSLKMLEGISFTIA